MTEEYSGPERRVARRTALSLTGNLRERGNRPIPAIITGLTSRGCSVADTILSSSATTVWIRLPGLESLPARRCWSTLSKGGFEFDHPLHPAVVQRFTGEAPVLSAPPANDEPLGVMHQPEWNGSRRHQILHGVAEVSAGPLTTKRERSAPATLGGLVRRHHARVIDHRLEKRFSPPAEAVLGFRAAGQPLAVHDISPSGVKLGGELPGSIGDAVQVAFAGFPPLEGTIVWVRQGATGVRLPDQALDLFEAA